MEPDGHAAADPAPSRARGGAFRARRRVRPVGLGPPVDRPRRGGGRHRQDAAACRCAHRRPLPRAPGHDRTGPGAGAGPPVRGPGRRLRLRALLAGPAPPGHRGPARHLGRRPRAGDRDQRPRPPVPGRRRLPRAGRVAGPGPAAGGRGGRSPVGRPLQPADPGRPGRPPGRDAGGAGRLPAAVAPRGRAGAGPGGPGRRRGAPAGPGRPRRPGRGRAGGRGGGRRARPAAAGRGRGAGGNPLFVTELVAALLEEGRSGSPAAAPRWPR
jgi:hypothetical protein